MKKSNLKIIVFCGGVGTRLWPVSRASTPKQFENIVGDRSLVQNTVDRLLPLWSPQEIFISTGSQYTEFVEKQLPQIPKKNIIAEPEMRDTGPAMLYAMTVVASQLGEDALVSVLWQDHLIKDQELFREMLLKAEDLVAKGTKIAYLAIIPRYPSVNLGYIKTGKVIKTEGRILIREFEKFVEKPDLTTAEQFLKDGSYFWNPGYFVTTPKFIISMFKKFAPDTYEKMQKIEKLLGKPNSEEEIKITFESIEKRAVDYIVHENIDPKDALVLPGDLGWSDIGEWRALKEALEHNPEENIVKGRHIDYNSKGCLIYSYTDRMIATVGLNNMVIVDTPDVLLVCEANSAPDVKKLVEQLKKEKKQEYL